MDSPISDRTFSFWWSSYSVQDSLSEPTHSIFIIIILYILNQSLNYKNSSKSFEFWRYIEYIFRFDLFKCSIQKHMNINNSRYLNSCYINCQIFLITLLFKKSYCYQNRIIFDLSHFMFSYRLNHNKTNRKQLPTYKYVLIVLM